MRPLALTIPKICWRGVKFLGRKWIERRNREKLGEKGSQGLSPETVIPSEVNFGRRFSRLLSQKDVEGYHRLVKIRLE